MVQSGQLKLSGTGLNRTLVSKSNLFPRLVTSRRRPFATQTTPTQGKTHQPTQPSQSTQQTATTAINTTRSTITIPAKNNPNPPINSQNPTQIPPASTTKPTPIPSPPQQIHDNQFTSRTARKYNLPKPDRPEDFSVLSEKLNSQKKIKNKRFFTKLLFLTTIISSSFFISNIINTPGFNRSKTFWSRAFPIYLHYQSLILWLDFRQYLTKILIRYDNEYYAPILESLGLDYNGEPIDYSRNGDDTHQINQKILDFDTTNRSDSDKDGQNSVENGHNNGQNSVQNGQKVQKSTKIEIKTTNPVTQWSIQKAEADIAYINQLRALIETENDYEKSIGNDQNEKNDKNIDKNGQNTENSSSSLSSSLTSSHLTSHTNSNTLSTSQTPFERPIEIGKTSNNNKLDRLFANFNNIAETLRKSTEFQQLQVRLERLQSKALNSINPTIIVSTTTAGLSCNAIITTTTDLSSTPTLTTSSSSSPTNLEFDQFDQVSLELKGLINDTLAIAVHIPPFHQSFFWLKTQFLLLTGAIRDSIPLDETTKRSIEDGIDDIMIWSRENVIRPIIKKLSPPLRQFAMPLEKNEIKNYRNLQFEPLNTKYAFDIYDIIAQLKGYYIKIGQLGAMRGEFLPKQWIKELSKFQNECPFVPFADLVPMVESEIGRLHENFDYIDPKPLGSASIGQVHLATLKNGQKVVVKIQYPDVEETFYQDMKTIRTFCELAQPEQLPQLTEVETAFLSEFNFAKEAVQLHFAEEDLKFAKNFGTNGQNKDDPKSEFSKFIKIPQPIPHLCSKHVLVMEYLPGQRLGTFLQNSVEKMAEQQGLTLEQFLEKYGNSPPPTTEEIRNYRQMASQYDYFTNLSNSAYNWTLGWVLPQKEYQKTEVPVDIRRIVQYVYQAHGHQVFNGHCLNSDPHPGNILFKADETNDLGGIIGLIDYGQVKSIPLWYRTALAHLMIALEEENWAKVANICFFSGYRSVHNYQEQTVEQTVLGFDFDDDISRRGMNIENYFTYISGIDKPLHIQEKLALAGQATFFLRALPQRLNFTVKASHMWAPFARDFLKQHPILDNVFNEGLEEFSEYYQKELILAKQRAIENVGNADEYFVDLSQGFHIQDWAEAIGQIYDDRFYKEIYTYPFPQDLIQYGLKYDPIMKSNFFEKNQNQNNENNENNENIENKNENNPDKKQQEHLRGEHLVEITQNIDISEFIPKEGSTFEPKLNPNGKNYNFYEKKPNFVKKLEKNYKPPGKNSKNNV